MPYLAQHGYESYAVSLRGHAGSDPAEEGSCSMSVQLDDLSSLISSLPCPPVLIGHSVGGIISQRYLVQLSHGSNLPELAGVVLMANSGPRQSMPTSQWFKAQRSLWHSARVFWWMIKRPVHDASLVRDMFFSDDLPKAEFQRYHKQLSQSPSIMPITSADMQMKLTLGPHSLPPVIAVGGEDDGIVMRYQLEDAADFFRTNAVVVPKVAHDVMLDTRWQRTADVLVDWLHSLTR